MLISLRMQASIALLATSLCLGCGSDVDEKSSQPQLTMQQSYKANKESQPIINIITLKNSNDSLTYTNVAQPYARYKWAIVDEDNKPLTFYGQGSNEVTISHMTEQSISTGNIKISCTVTLGKQEPNTVNIAFTIEQSAIERLTMQTAASGDLVLDKLKVLLTKEADDIVAAVKADPGINSKEQRIMRQEYLQGMLLTLNTLKLMFANSDIGYPSKTQLSTQTAEIYKTPLCTYTTYFKSAYDINIESFLFRLDEFTQEAVSLKLPLGDYGDILTVITDRLAALSNDKV